MLGDSAYAIQSFIIPPYDKASSKSPEDAFNFYHSSARIIVECAFGEIDLRWGIFWRRIQYKLEHTMIICEEAMHLHNFLVDYRNSLDNSDDEIRTERNIFIDDNIDNGYLSSVIGNDNYRIGGRPTNEEKYSRERGLQLRDYYRGLLQDHNMQRPIYW